MRNHCALVRRFHPRRHSRSSPPRSLSRYLQPVDAKTRGLRVLVLTAEYDGATRKIDTTFYQRVYGAESVQVEAPWPAMAHNFFCLSRTPRP